MSELRLGKLNIHHPGVRERERGERSYVTLSAFTPKGVLREISVDDRELLQLAQDATKFALILFDLREAS